MGPIEDLSEAYVHWGDQHRGEEHTPIRFTHDGDCSDNFYMWDSKTRMRLRGGPPQYLGQGSVYFIEDAQSNAVKIGWAGNVSSGTRQFKRPVPTS